MNNIEKQIETTNNRTERDLTAQSSALVSFAIEQAFSSMNDSPEQMEELKYSDYFSDRRSENIDSLECRPKLRKMYEYAVLRHNHINHVALVDDEELKNNAYFTTSEHRLNGKDDKLISSVHFNVMHNFDNRERQEPEVLNLIKKVALQLGADWRDIYKNRDAFDSFVLMHEFGHAADFISTHYIPMAESNDSVPELLKKAFEKSWGTRKKESESLIKSKLSIDEMRDKKFLPLNEDPNDEDPIKRKAIRSDVRKRIDSYNKSQYRQMADEKKADFFAAEMIRQNYDLFFRPQGVEDNGRNLIEVGKSVNLDLEDWREVIGLHQGDMISATRVMFNEKGHVVPKLYDGKPMIVEGTYDPIYVDEPNLYINKYNDQNRPKSLLLTNINSVRARRNKETKNLEYLLADENGAMYKMQILDADEQ